MKKRDLIIYCDRGSNAASILAFKLLCRRVRGVRKRTNDLRCVDGCLVVNYGTSTHDVALSDNRSIVLNPPSVVSLSISKVKSYERFKEAGIPIVEFTTDINEARGWHDGGTNVLCRRDGLSGGSGISFSKDGGGVCKADFYTKYFPKTHEYRVHVFRSSSEQLRSGAQVQSPRGGTSLDPYRVIDITQKKLSLSGGLGVQGNRRLHQRVVRSLENGWVHAHEGLHLPGDFREVISNAAIRAVEVLGLDFGAVDIIAQFGTKDINKLYGIAVLEVNTAPGLGNEKTIEAYVSAIQAIYDSTSSMRAIHVSSPRYRQVKRLVNVTFKSKKGNTITRPLYRYVKEKIE